MTNGLSFSVAEKTVRIQAGEIDPPGQRPAILLLHGAGGHVDFWFEKLGSLLAEARIGLYAPHYFDRTGTVRADPATLTDGIHVPLWLEAIDASLAWVASRPTVDPAQIVLAGVSLGGFLGLALAAQLSASADSEDRQRIRALIDVSGGLAPPYDALATAAMPPTLILHGAADTIVPVRFAHELDRKLTDLAVAHRTEILPGEGHWFSSAVLPRILLAVSEFLAPILAS